MGYSNLNRCLTDLEQTRQLIRIDQEIDPYLEMAEIQRRVYQASGPALLFTNVKDCRFPMMSNLFGTLERTRWIFRNTLDAVRHLVDLKIDPMQFMRHPWQYRDVLGPALHMLPRKAFTGPVLKNRTSIDQLPKLVSWPKDGGPFITLPQVYTEHPDKPSLMNSNLGMYRVQLSGNEYAHNTEIGMHYQIHRSIGVHHAAAIEKGEPLRVNIFVGGAPAMTLAAVMPLPEGMSELTFAGALSGKSIRMVPQRVGPAVYGEADFCITGTIDPDRVLPEGPFGDHLGYYSDTHDFPVLKVEHVYHRDGAVWPFTVVGRPPQEDTSFGALIHEITGPAIPSVIKGVHAVNAVDASGVHPLLLAIGSERYVPYAQDRTPQELLTCANAILGQGQLSLAKYLFIVAKEDNPALDIHKIPDFLSHLLSRVDWTRDLHFQTRTTMDTLDYSGTGLNAGSKLVIAAAGKVKRELPTEMPSGIVLPDRFTDAQFVLPGALAVQGPEYVDGNDDLKQFCQFYNRDATINQFPLIVIVDDASFLAATLNNFLWATFTRSNPATDIEGIDSFTDQKHWGCHGSLVIDARLKPHHQEPLVEDSDISRRVDALAVTGGPLHGII
ncbi:4-hydroxybenzoate decarboxylase subunit C [Polystyrenella longa]|uniref:4-hydroxybenzoate decarboxylase subunit C n=1 Tax=Polystyrenella longa TaxID=2528007 RepID=A0A518CN45_9PLAN|nr:UbiD family decarboxylase [Polystyrenella longa]QDU80647.1 4-hydroxybenzoate decarboxylase subunit C [Polystyrenella longa]